MTNVYELPKDLPVPQDDGAASHLIGQQLPSIALTATDGSVIDIGTRVNTVVIYCYPMTGEPNVPLPDGWDQIPGSMRPTSARITLAGYPQLRGPLSNPGKGTRLPLRAHRGFERLRLFG